MKRKIFLFILNTLFIIGLISIHGPFDSTVQATWPDDCASALDQEVECILTDVWDTNSNLWRTNVSSFNPGDIAIFGTGYWNNKSTGVTSVNIKINIPAGTSFVPNSVTARLNGVNITAPGDEIFSTGWTYPGTFPADSSIMIHSRIQLPSVGTPGTTDFTLTSDINTGSGFSDSNSAIARVDFPPFSPSSGLNADYYTNKYIAGAPDFSRVDPVVDSTQISWPLVGGPGGNLGSDDFSVSWYGQVMSTFTENIDLRTSSDDGIRVFFDDQLVINEWVDRGQPGVPDSATVAMTAGVWYNIRIDYYEHGHDSIAQLYWNGTNQTGGANQIIPQTNLRTTYTGNLNYGLTGRYYNGTDPIGNTPIVTRIDQSPYFYFDLVSPAPGVNSDNFSVSWTGKVVADFNETYTFCTQSDDGTRLWIDNQPVLDNFTSHPLQEHCGNIALTVGDHDIRLDYFDDMQDAAIGFLWQATSQTGGNKVLIPIDHLKPLGFTGVDYGLLGEYFNNNNLAGLPSLTRIDSDINFDFWTGTPDGVINTDNFSIRWTGKVLITETGNHNFYLDSDDGVRLTLDGNLLIDEWQLQTRTKNQTGNVFLTPGSYDLKIEYFEGTGAAGVFFTYETPSSGGEIFVPPNVLHQ